MDNLEFFARKNNLKLKSSASGEYFLCGREGRIRSIKGKLGVQLEDQTCLPGKAVEGFTRILLFNPNEAQQAKLALEIIETVGQPELTTDERRKKVKRLERLGESEPLRFFAQKHGLKVKGGHKPYILGGAGRIYLLDGGFVVDLNDQTCVTDQAAEDVRVVPFFNPADELQSKLALEVIETTGQKELTFDERKTKVELLHQLRWAEPSEEESASV